MPKKYFIIAISANIEISDWLSTTEGQPLFEPDGSPAEFLNQLTNLMQKRFPQPNRDTPVLEAINQADILEPWLDISENLLKADPRKLAELDDQVFLGLRQKGALMVIHAHLMSLPRINRIRNLAQRKEQIAERQMQRNDSMGISLDVDEDILRFH